MALVYTSSLDHYGYGLGPATGTAGGSWPITTTQIIGDAWTASPAMGVTTGVYAQGSYDIRTPSWGARQGSYALVASSVRCKGGVGGTSYVMQGSESMRLAIPGASQATRLIQFAFSCSDLPTQDKLQGQIVHLMNSSGTVVMTLAVSPSGRLELLDHAATTVSVASPYQVTGGPAALLVSNSSVIQAQTWYNINISIVNNGANYNVNVYVNAVSNPVLSNAALVGSTTGNIDMLGFLPASAQGGSDTFSETTDRAVRDIIIMDTTGTRANALVAQAFVSAQSMSTQATTGWDVRPRQNYTNGVLDHHDTQGGVYVTDTATLEIGASDYTVETMARFASLPTSGNTGHLMAKWRSDTSNRSWRLYWDATSATLKFDISTDGAATISLKSQPWTPVLGYWYHVAVSRAAGVTRLFVNGRQLGVGTADTNTYFNGTAPQAFGGQINTTSVIAGTAFDGFLDETRITIGVGRYTANFVPPTASFGRNVGGDPSFASVALLMGYEGSIADESSHALVVNTGSPAPVAQNPADNAYSYQVLNQRPSWDDTFIEAPLLYAQGTLTFTGLPTAGETVTVGSKTYTWANPVGAANTVLIGASTSACINNLIAALNASAGAGTTYGTGTVANASAQGLLYQDPQMQVRALAAGSAANSVVTTDTMANGAWDAPTLEGGESIPAASDFAMQRLLTDVSGIVAVQVSARAYKTDAGTSQIRYDLVGAAGAVGTGTAFAPDLNPAWTRQVFDTDPDTSAGITPSTLIGGKLRFTRTS